MSKDQIVSVIITKAVSVFSFAKKNWGQELDDWKYIDEIEAINITACRLWEATKMIMKGRT